jgi:hypothetical protein
MAMLQIAVAAPGTCLAPGNMELGTFDTQSLTHNTTTFTRYRHLGQHTPLDDISPETHSSTRYLTRYADHSPALGCFSAIRRIRSIRQKFSLMG